ncbi:MAG: BrnA antitoxin family protein [Prochloron sp. SP5CPC1]|nr:BrnA antitoxin family protein [Candidatus Paraprochloron terpiosi SP5CPC1]
MNGKNLSNTSRSNWKALEEMEDEDIDYSGIPPLTDEFFESATLRVPAPIAQRLVQIDPDILKWFQTQGGEYKTLINSVLRRYMERGGEQSGEKYYG